MNILHWLLLVSTGFSLISALYFLRARRLSIDIEKFWPGAHLAIQTHCLLFRKLFK